jgi:hypothetical protein
VLNAGWRCERPLEEVAGVCFPSLATTCHCALPSRLPAIPSSSLPASPLVPLPRVAPPPAASLPRAQTHMRHLRPLPRGPLARLRVQYGPRGAVVHHAAAAQRAAAHVQPRAHEDGRVLHSDAKVANRDIRVWHLVTENGP